MPAVRVIVTWNWCANFRFGPSARTQHTSRPSKCSAVWRGNGGATRPTVLVGLIAAYEQAKYPVDVINKMSAGEIVRHLLAERSMSINTLAKATGVAQSSLSDMRNGKRDCGKLAIVQVADYFGLQPGMFLR